MIKFLNNLANKTAREKTFQELNRMTDRQLRDIGITRGDIQCVADGSYVRGQ